MLRSLAVMLVMFSFPAWAESPEQSREGARMKPEKVYGRLNWIRSSNPLAASRPVIVGIPGGPGLSSATLRGMEVLAEGFDVVLVDPPGTGGTEEMPLVSLQ